MYHVYIYRNGAECSVCVWTGYVKQSANTWSHRLNNNYEDDVREIQLAVSGLGPRVDEYGDWWVRCDPTVLKCTILKIIRARMPARVPMWFLRDHVRNAMVALAATRLLPRDLLREVHARLQVDEFAEMCGLFQRYTSLRYIRGLYMRLDDGPLVRVINVYSRKTGPRYQFMEIDVAYGGKVISYLKVLLNCTHHRGAHFCLCLRDAHLGLAGRTEGDDSEGFYNLFVIKFTADAAIEFVHKDPHKRVVQN